MKKIKFFWLLLVLFAFKSNVKAQCPTNPYELVNNYVATFHAGAAKASTNKWYAWGQDHGGSSGNSATNIFEVNNTNYSLLPAGAVVKFVSGGSDGDGKNQLVALVSSATSATNANKIYSLVDTFNSNNQQVMGGNVLSLPTGITAADVTSFYAGYGMIAIVAGGKGYIYNYKLGNNVFGDGVTTGTPKWGSSVKSSATGNPEITNFVSIRGASVDSGSGVLIGLTSDGNVYTWGQQTFIGSGTAVANYTRATLATPTPAAAGAKVTLVGANFFTSATLYAMFDNGEFWSLGNGSGGRLGDFGTANQTSWVRVKRSNPTAPATDYADVIYFTTQEHDGFKTDASSEFANQASVQMMLKDNSVYGFGRDGGYILGVGQDSTGGLFTHPKILQNQPLAGPPVVPQPIDGTTDERTGLAIEMGGHISFIYKKSDNFCAAGHGKDGSLLGTDASAFTQYFSDCATTTTLIPCKVVAPTIIAKNDAITVGIGQTSGNVLADNGNGADTVNGTAATAYTATNTSGTATITQESTTNAGVTVNANGTISVAAGTTAGTYTVVYKICETPQPASGANCSTAVATITVSYSCSGNLVQTATWGTLTDGTSTASASASATAGSAPNNITVTVTSPGITGGTGNTDFNFITEKSAGNGWFSATSATANTSPTSGTGYLFYTPGLVSSDALKFEAYWDQSGTNSVKRTVNFKFSKPITSFLIHIDRFGGQGGGNPAETNSSLWTVTTPGVTLSKLTGNSVLTVTGTTFYRPIESSTTMASAESNSTPPTAAGTILVSSSTPFTQVDFTYEQYGRFGAGYDGIEMIIQACLGSACYKPANTTTGTAANVTHGITALQRAAKDNADTSQWPIKLKGAYTALDAKTKGFVINRLTATQISALTPVVGMAVYDVTNNCLKIYTGATNGWKCFDKAACDQ